MLLVILAIAALAILACVVLVSLGKGGELTEFPPDVPPLNLPDTGKLGAVDIMALQLPLNLIGYHTQSVDETLRRAAEAISARDTRIAVLEQRVSELLSSRLHARQEVHATPGAGPRTEHEPPAAPLTLPAETDPLSNGHVPTLPEDEPVSAHERPVWGAHPDHDTPTPNGAANIPSGPETAAFDAVEDDTEASEKAEDSTAPNYESDTPAYGAEPEKTGRNAASDVASEAGLNRAAHGVPEAALNERDQSDTAAPDGAEPEKTGRDAAASDAASEAGHDAAAADVASQAGLDPAATGAPEAAPSETGEDGVRWGDAAESETGGDGVRWGDAAESETDPDGGRGRYAAASERGAGDEAAHNSAERAGAELETDGRGAAEPMTAGRGAAETETDGRGAVESAAVHDGGADSAVSETGASKSASETGPETGVSKAGSETGVPGETGADDARGRGVGSLEWGEEAEEREPVRVTWGSRGGERG
ncbi:MAG TPA: hypothetical protein VKZ82_15865 [Nonomuraea sp.]|nr:hypothetical protein [Nonomuraea sp.]